MDSAVKIGALLTLFALLRLFVTFPAPGQGSDDDNDGVGAGDAVGKEQAPEVSDDPQVMFLSKPKGRAAVLRNRIEYTLQFAERAGTTSMSLIDHIEKQTGHLIMDDQPKPTDPITLVTGVWDIAEFSAHEQQLVRAFRRHALPKVVFVDKATHARVARAFEGDANVKFVILPLSKLVGGFGKAAEDVQGVRTNPAWFRIAPWLRDSGFHSSLEFTLATLAAPLLLREAARADPFNTAAFFWVDLTDACLHQHVLTQENTALLNRLATKLVLPFSTVPVGDAEVLGFRQPSFSHYTHPNGNAGKTVRAAHGGLFGGQIAHIEMVALIYDMTLRTAVAEGLLGTTEALLTIVSTRFPHLFSHVAHTDACLSAAGNSYLCPKGTNPDAAVCGLTTLSSLLR